MKLITSLDQHELGFHESSDSSISHTRHAARAVMINDRQQIAVMHFTGTGSYKLPGGGIDDGESAEEALRREVREETGYEIATIHELGIVEEDRYFCGVHQTSYCFVTEAGQFVGIELTEKEAAEGMELVWVDSIDQAIEAVNSSSVVDEGSSLVGLEMMKMRDVAILGAAKEVISE
jgi:8-oxo-dGTP pyrophosphatase MutT (NUDIX family)